MLNPEKAELKKEKRIQQVMWRSIGAAGIGIGLFFLRFVIAPFIGENEQALHSIAVFAFSLIGFGAVMIATYLFKRDMAPKVYLAMIWVILPAILVKLLAETF